MKLSAISLLGSLVIASIGGSFGVWIIQNGLPFMMSKTVANVPLTDTISQNQPVSSEDLSTQKEFEVMLLEALEISKGEIDGQPYSVEQEIEDEIPVVEVALSKYEVVIHAQDKEILLVEDLEAKGDPEDVAEFTEALMLQTYAEISLAEAIMAAEEFTQKQANSAELENEDDNLVYEVLFGLEKVYIDAGNGQILHSNLLKQKSDQDDLPLNSSIRLDLTEDDHD